MNRLRKSSWLFVLAVMVVFLIAVACAGSASTPVAHNCQGDLTVVESDVARVTPSPRQVYVVNQSYSWTEPPYGVEVTGSDGEAVMQIYNASNSLLAKYTILAASSAGGSISVNKWNGLSEITFNAGNFIIEDNKSQDICNLELFAGGVGLTSVGTTYVVTVRPDINEVIIGVLDGIVEVTSRGQTVTLDASVPTRALVVVSDGSFGPLLPIPDPGQLLDEVSAGHDIQYEPQTPDTLPEPLNTGTLTLWADDRLLLVLEEIGALFENDTGVQLLVEPMPLSEIFDRYLTALESGTAPDLLTLSHQQSYELVTGGYVLPLDQRIDPEILIPGTVSAFSYQFDIYAAPYAYDNLALVSNLEYVPEIPPTWSELLKYAAELSFGREFFTSLMIPADGYHFYPVQSAFGGHIFGQSRDGTFDAQNLGMISDGSLAAAGWLEELVATQPVFLGDENEALRNFQGWNAAMILTGPWSLPRLREMDVLFQVNSFPREAVESQPFLSVYGFLISRSSQSPDAAQNLLWNYLTTYQAVQAYSNVLGIPPARRDVLENLEDADLRAFGFAGVNGVPIPNLPEMNAVWGPWSDAIRAIISGEMSGAEAFRNAYNIIMKEIGQ